MELTDAAAVARFQTYLRMKTVHPDPTAGYVEMGAFLKERAAAIGLELEQLELVPGHLLYILKWAGSHPELGSVVLNSHMDVVPVDADKWTKDPWAAEIIDGKIYGRGTQDMKSVGAQYLEAVARLKASGFVPQRSVVLLYVPDEEVGGGRGMRMLLQHMKVKELNPAIVLDEGLASPDGRYSIFYGERKIWWLRVTATGAAGHGSRFVPGTAVMKLHKVLTHMLGYREEQSKALEASCGCGKQLGDFTSVNCTMLHAGVEDPSRPQFNVIPTTAVAGFDVRIPATVDLEAFRAQVMAWCTAEEGVTVEWVAGSGDMATLNPTSTIDPSEAWWRVFTSAIRSTGAEFHEPSIFPAATDSRWVRLMLPSVPCYGFSPIRNTPILLHDHDEFVPVSVFCEGIAAYEKIIPALANADLSAAAAAPAPAASS